MPKRKQIFTSNAPTQVWCFLLDTKDKNSTVLIADPSLKTEGLRRQTRPVSSIKPSVTATAKKHVRAAAAAAAFTPSPARAHAARRAARDQRGVPSGRGGRRRGGDHLRSRNKATPSMRRRGTSARGAAQRKAQLLPGRALRGSPATRAGPRPPTAARRRRPPQPRGLHSPPPHHRRAARPHLPAAGSGPPRPPWLPKRLHSLAKSRPMPGLGFPPSPQGTQRSARRRRRRRLRGSLRADAARGGPGAAAGRGGEGEGEERAQGAAPPPRPTAARCEGPPQRLHGWRGAARRASSRTPAAGASGRRGSVSLRRAAATGRALPRGPGSSAAGEEGAVPRGVLVSCPPPAPPGGEAAPAAVVGSGARALPVCAGRVRFPSPGGAVAGPRPSLR